MRFARIRTLSIVLGGFAALTFAGLHFKKADFYRFWGIRGPEAPSALTPPPYAKIADFDKGSTHRLAVLVTDPESGWLGLARGLKAHGIPFTMTQDLGKAMQHQAVVVYPGLSWRAFTPQQVQQLHEHVANGGALLAFDLAGAGLGDVFGVSSLDRTPRPSTLIWTHPRGVAEEDVIPVNKPGSEAQMSLASPVPTTASVEARYDDRTPAVTCQVSKGRACLMGVDLGALSERAMNGRGEPLARHYVNQYEPALDVLYKWVEDFYVQSEPYPWLVGAAPAGRSVSIVLSHDIDFTRSVKNSRAYSDLIASRSLSGTFFMQTKYVRDYNDDVFMNNSNIPDLKYLLRSGMEIGSHTVSHSVVFKNFPLGTGKEAYPDYRPFVKSRLSAEGGSLFGETRVSKYLLERLVGAKISSFRAGHLSFPFKLPDVLAAEGYGFDSSITADACLTHLPFQLTAGREDERLEPVFELPVTIEDEEAPKLGDRFDAANTVVEKIARHSGVAVFLIHPDITGHKLDFERRLIDRWRDRAWIGSVRDFGGWWRARNDLETDIVTGPGGPRLEVSASTPVDGVEIRLPKAVDRSARTMRLDHLIGTHDLELPARAEPARTAR